MKINEWGVFVERPDTSTYEIKLSEELAGKVYDYIEKLKEDEIPEDILDELSIAQANGAVGTLQKYIGSKWWMTIKGI